MGVCAARAIAVDYLCVAGSKEGRVVELHRPLHEHVGAKWDAAEPNFDLALPR